MPEQEPAPPPTGDLEWTVETGKAYQIKLGSVGIELVDADDQPVPGKKYVVTLPDGTTLEGELDGSGCAKVENITQSGSVTVSFPDLDPASWELIAE